MKIELETPQTLSLDRKIKMHEAREAIIDRLARDLPTNIDLERFLTVVVRSAPANRGKGAADKP
jgi:hypothetical protein